MKMSMCVYTCVKIFRIDIFMQLNILCAVPEIPDNIDLLVPMTFPNLVHLVVPFAPHWEKIGTILKLQEKVEELKQASFTDSVKMTMILDNWSVYGDEFSWLNLLEEMEDDEELLPLVADIRKYLIEKVHTSSQSMHRVIVYCVMHQCSLQSSCRLKNCMLKHLVQ